MTVYHPGKGKSIGGTEESMTDFLVRHFVKDAGDVKNTKVRERYGRLGGLVGICVNLLLAFSKMGVGLLFGSVAVLADGVNNLSDAGSSIVTLLGFKLAAKPADKEHPFGHARLEYITGLLISFLIIYVGIELVKSSVEKILHPGAAEFSLLSVAVLMGSILLKLWLSHFYKNLSRRTGSSVFEATAADSRNDVCATSAVLLCTLLLRFTGVDLDGVAGLLVAVFIIVSGIKLILETSSPLLGEAPDRELVQEIYRKVLSYDKVLGVHDLVVHSYGPGRWFASLHAEMDYKNDVMESHDITDRIERDFAREGISMVVHLDPIVTDDAEVSALRGRVEAALREIHPKLSLHDFRMVKGVYHTNVIFDVAVPQEYAGEDSRLIADIQHAVSRIDEHLYAVVELDRCYLGL